MNIAERHRMDRSERKAIGLRLKAARHRKGLTAQHVAQCLGLRDRSSIYCYEYGRNTPSSPVLAKMAVLYGVTMDKIWFG